MQNILSHSWTATASAWDLDLISSSSFRIQSENHKHTHTHTHSLSIYPLAALFTQPHSSRTAIRPVAAWDIAHNEVEQELCVQYKQNTPAVDANLLKVCAFTSFYFSLSFFIHLRSKILCVQTFSGAFPHTFAGNCCINAAGKHG